jgi:hypothetical protein
MSFILTDEIAFHKTIFLYEKVLPLENIKHFLFYSFKMLFWIYLHLWLGFVIEKILLFLFLDVNRNLNNKIFKKLSQVHAFLFYLSFWPEIGVKL